MDDTFRRDLNWNLLRTFHVIAEERSLTKAAKRLGIRQPSVSEQLRRFEEQVGCQLIVRDSRNFAMTLRGTRIHRECAAIFQGVERIGYLTRGPDDSLVGELSLMIVSNLVSPMIDEALRLFHQRHPSVVYRIEVLNSQTIVGRLRKGHPGFGICLMTKPAAGLECHSLFREEFGIFCGAEHPFFNRETVALRDLQDESFIAFTCAEEGLGLEPMVLLREAANLGGRIAGTSPNLEEVRRMIVAGIGIGILPIATVSQDVADGKLWPLRLSGQSIGADVFLARNPSLASSPTEKEFADLVGELHALYPNMT